MSDPIADFDAYLVRRLERAANRDDLVFEISRKTGQSWEQAAAYLDDLETRNASRIQRRQAPILLILSLGALLAGLALGLAYYLQVSAALREMLGRAAGLREIFAYAVAATYNLPGLIAGATLAAGGLMGVFTTLLKREPWR